MCHKILEFARPIVWGKGDDFCDGNEEAIERIAQYEASIGVTAIAPATMTLPVEELKQILSVAAKYKKINTHAQI